MQTPKLFSPLKCRHLQSAARGGRPPSPSLPAVIGRIIQKVINGRIMYIFRRGVVYYLEEVNRLDNSPRFKAFESLDVSEKLLFITKVLHIHR